MTCIGLLSIGTRLLKNFAFQNFIMATHAQIFGEE